MNRFAKAGARPLLLLLVSAAVLSTHLGWAGLRAISGPVYGDDDRQDLSSIRHATMAQLADSTVLLLLRSKLTYQSGTDDFAISALSVGKKRNLCTTETFYDQPAPGFCSGTLVGPDLILTAGHCIEDQSTCNGTSVAFGYSERTPGQPPTSVPAAEMYSCKEVVARSSSPDWAVIRLDRPVSNHLALPVERGAVSVRPGDRIFAIGHPHGMPTKITSGTIRADGFTLAGGQGFKSNLDTFTGNSGSAVFNAEGRIVGILVSGDDDYVDIVLDGVKCKVVKRCSLDGCKGEISTYVQFAAGSIPALLADF